MPRLKMFGVWNEDSIKALSERRGDLKTEALAIVDKVEAENRDLTIDEQKLFDSLCDQDQQLKARIANAERVDSWGAELNEPPDDPFGNITGTTAPSGFY